MLKRLMYALKWAGLGVILGLVLTWDAEAATNYTKQEGNFKYTVKCDLGNTWQTLFASRYDWNQYGQIVVADPYEKLGPRYVKAAEIFIAPIDRCFIYKFKE